MIQTVVENAGKTDAVVKIAENPDEAFWDRMKTRCEEGIETSKKEIEINTHILKLVAEKLKQFRKV